MFPEDLKAARIPEFTQFNNSSKYLYFPCLDCSFLHKLVEQKKVLNIVLEELGKKFIGNTTQIDNIKLK